MSVLPCFLNVHWQICFVGTNVQIMALKKRDKKAELTVYQTFHKLFFTMTKCFSSLNTLLGIFVTLHSKMLYVKKRKEKKSHLRIGRIRTPNKWSGVSPE